MIQTFIRQEFENINDDIIMKYVVEKPIIGTIVKVGDNLYIIDEIKFFIKDNFDKRPYRRGINKNIIIKIRRGNRIHDLMSANMPLETSDFIIAVGDESIKVVGHINTIELTEQEIQDITSGFMIGDTIVTEDMKEKIIIEFTGEYGDLSVIAISKNSKSPNPVKGRYEISRIKKVVK